MMVCGHACDMGCLFDLFRFAGLFVLVLVLVCGLFCLLPPVGLFVVSLLGLVC